MWLWCCVGAVSWACDTPVFEYALTQWPADEYELIVFHRGGAGVVKLLGELRAGCDRGANLVVRESDLEKGHLYEELLVDSPASSWPWLVVRYPARYAGVEGGVGGQVATRSVAWAGPLEAGTPAAWLSSPVREELARLLLNGCAAVWLFLPGGDRPRDDDAYRVLSLELARLERTLTVGASGGKMDGELGNAGVGGAPDSAETGGAGFRGDRGVSGSSGVGPAGETESGRVRFGILRVLRTDLRERALLAMLLGSEPDLAGQVGKPMVFPVYGRGRVLYALVGAGINERTIGQAAEFVCGACSCEVKSQNPGLELLISADWEKQAVGAAGLAGFLEQREALLAADGTGMARVAASSESGTTEPACGLGCGRIVAVGAGVLVLVFCVGFAVVRRRSGVGL